MLTIGIDAGLTGAIATLDEHGEFAFLADLPISVHGKLKWVDGAELLRTLFAARDTDKPARVFVEHVHAMPKLGVIAANSKGLTLGSILSILQVAELPIELVVPGKWKRALGLIAPESTDQEKKSASLDRARMLFPKASLTRFKDHGRAEALLIAHYAHRFALKRDLFTDEAAA